MGSGRSTQGVGSSHANLERSSLPRLMTADEVARTLRISRRRVYILVDRGALRAYRVGRNLRVSTTDLAEMLESARVEVSTWP